jgi:hypothetical protein
MSGIDQLIHEHISQLERKFDVYSKNPAPTVPIYDLTVVSGPSIVWTYDGVSTVSATFTSIVGHVYALCLDDINHNENILGTETVVTATSTTTTISITDINFLYNTNGSGGTDYTLAQAAGFVFSVILFDRTANLDSANRDGFAIAVNTFVIGTFSHGIEWTPVTWNYDGLTFGGTVSATYQSHLPSAGFDPYFINIWQPVGFTPYIQVRSSAEVDGDGSMQTINYNFGGIFNFVTTGTQFAVMLVWRSGDIFAAPPMPSYVFSFSQISTRIFTLGTAGAGVKAALL